MSDLHSNYGILLNQNAKLHRQYFKECCKLIGINCIYRAPKEIQNFDTHGDLNTLDYNYEKPKLVGCIFEDHPDQKTLKKRGWVAELQENSSMIHVPYDLEGLQVGGLFIVPSGLDQAEGRVFRVISMKNIMIYPASIACEIAPEYADNMESNSTNYFKENNFTLLKDNEGDD